MKKIRELQFFKNKTFRKAAVMLVLACLFLSLFLLFFNMFQSSLIQSLSQINNEFVEQVDIISGTLLEIINNTAMQMFYSRSLKTLRTSTNLTNPERIAGTRDLGNWVISSSFLSNAKIYNGYTDTVFTSEGEYVENASLNYSETETIELLLRPTKHGSEGPVKRKTTKGDTYSFLFFEPNIPNGGSLLLNVRAEWYEKQLLGIASGQNIVILNEQGDILAAGNEELSAELRAVWTDLQKDLAENGNSGLYMQKGSKNGWMYHELSNLGLYYFRAFDTKTALPGITQIRNLVMILLTIVSILLLGGILYGLFELYMPIKEVQEVLQKAKHGKGDLVKQVDDLLTTQLEQQKAEQIDKLLSGQEMGLISYPVALILIESEEQTKIEGILNCLTSSEFLITTTNLGCAIIYQTALEEDLSKLCLALADSIHARCLCGHPCSSAPELALSHNNLLELWQLRFLYVDRKVLAEGLIKNHQETLDFHTKDTAPLFSALQAGQLEEARACWEEIFTRIRVARVADFRFYANYILKHLKNLAKELELEITPIPKNFLAELEDVSNLHKLLDNLFQQIAAEEQDKRKKSLNQLAAKVNQLISTDYANDSLSAQKIAEELGMNSTYLGRLYRESTGMSISDAIKQMRIEHAKKLLQETSSTVKDIALTVGFSNTKYFYVVFKEIAGMTPREFQEKKGLTD